MGKESPDEAYVKVKDSVDTVLVHVVSMEGMAENLEKNMAVVLKELRAMISASPKLQKGKMTLDDFLEIKKEAVKSVAFRNYAETYVVAFDKFKAVKFK